MSDQLYTTASGKVYVITEMWTPNSWATYERKKPNGNHKRLVSPRLPVRATYEEALADFKQWIGVKVTLSGYKDAREYAPVYRVWYPGVG